MDDMPSAATARPRPQGCHPMQRPPCAPSQRSLHARFRVWLASACLASACLVVTAVGAPGWQVNKAQAFAPGEPSTGQAQMPPAPPAPAQPSSPAPNTSPAPNPPPTPAAPAPAPLPDKPKASPPRPIGEASQAGQAGQAGQAAAAQETAGKPSPPQAAGPGSDPNATLTPQAHAQGATGKGAAPPEKAPPAQGRAPTPAAVSVPRDPLPAGAVVAVLPVRGGDEDHGGVTSAQLTALREQAERELVSGISRLGYRVLSPGQARARIKDKRLVEACLSALGRCNYRALLTPLGAKAVVAGALWLRDGQPVEVFVRVTREQTEGAVTQPVTQAKFLPAFKSAIGEALVRAEHPLSVAVRVDSVPKGANLLVDRRDETKTPAQLSLTPGKHLLVVSHPGFVTQSVFVDVPEASTGPVVKRVALRHDTGSAGLMDLNDLVGSAGDDGPAPWEEHVVDYAVGGVLALGAVAMLTAGIATALADGRCVEQDPDAERCVVEEDGNGTPLFVGAAVMGVTAAALFTLTPLTDLSETAGVQLTTKF